MIHLQSIEAKPGISGIDRYPFSIPVISSLSTLDLSTPVTVFVGENGSGKSTLLEAVAAAAELPVAGGEDMAADVTMAGPRELARELKLVWTRKSRRGFFLRAEDFFRFARRMAQLAEEMQAEARGFEKKFSGYALQLARGAVLGQRKAIVGRYGENLHEQSHGESFLQFFKSRLSPGGLYLLDEPETPLSPQRQLALISMILQMVQEQDCQFVISTHSPLLMAIPNARILSFDTPPIAEIPYDDVEHVVITRNFLNNPRQFLRHL